MGWTLGQIEPSMEVTYRLEWARLPHGWGGIFGVGLLAALLYAVVWMYRREGRAGATMRMRGLLAGLRGTVLLMLAAIWLEPVLATYVRRCVESYVLVLADASGSMRIKDRYQDPRSGKAVAAFLGVGEGAVGEVPRKALVEKVLNGGMLDELARRNRIKVFTFSGDASQVLTVPSVREKPAGEGLRPGPLRIDATGNTTDIGQAVRRAVGGLGGAPLSGIVLLSDGAINAGEPADVVGQYVRSQQAPLLAVGIGDPSRPRNARVIEVMAPSNAFVQDPFAVTAQISAEGLGNEEVLVGLWEGDRVLKEVSVRVSPDGRVEPVVFSQIADSSGRKVYRVCVADLPGESLVDDNCRQVTVNVIDNKMRVLLVSGGPSWQYRYLARLLERDATVQVSCWQQAADLDSVRDGNVVIDHLPTTEKELFQYDVIVLLDPDPIDLNESWCHLVSRLVNDYGGGVLFAAARKHTPTLARITEARPLLDLLPVQISADADLVLNELGHYQRREWSVGVPAASLGHPILSMGGSRASPDVWGRLGGVFWHYPVLREKPAATVLMRHTNPRMQNTYGEHVLLACQIVGAGRSVFLGFDGTWRWRQFGDEYFNRFWIQALRYLAEGRLQEGRNRVVLMTDRETYSVGETAVVTARLLNEAYQPLLKEEVKGTVTGADEEKRELVLKAIPGREGWYEGQLVAPRIGSYRVALALSEGGGQVTEAAKDIQVAASDIEMERPALDRETLHVLAEQSAGGQYLDIDQVKSIASLVDDRHQEFEIPGRPVILWDRWWTLAGLVFLLGLEWALRKRVTLL